jgi:hypothetical protein
MSRNEPPPKKHNEIRDRQHLREVILSIGLPVAGVTVLVSVVGAYAVTQSLMVGIAFVVLVGFLASFRWTVAKIRVAMDHREGQLPSLKSVWEEALRLLGAR